ncbi:class I histocompatibility antigen, F10 alpha chain-like [Numida meleagris]|uniref:class I histocompatibility antigen, F10 alpha chain-like n=1 Tax=Numida meleagris TaxID=8996 RepID=UPI000B3DD98C|nr:class I histocompatibility antigen, F10 alpha chain-like [Numida meleagris]
MAVGEVLRLGLLLGAVGAAALGPHSLRYFLTAMTDPGPGMPRFVAVGYVDGEAFASYDNESRRMLPIVPWLPQEQREHWDRETRRMQYRELDFYDQLDTVQKHYNTSGGAHTLQMMFGCDLLEDGSVRGYNQYAYDGRDFITFHMEMGRSRWPMQWQKSPRGDGRRRGCTSRDGSMSWGTSVLRT